MLQTDLLARSNVFKYFSKLPCTAYITPLKIGENWLTMSKLGEKNPLYCSSGCPERHQGVCQRTGSVYSAQYSISDLIGQFNG